jgi:hypothetical protein
MTHDGEPNVPPRKRVLEGVDEKGNVLACFAGSDRQNERLVEW